MAVEINQIPITTTNLTSGSFFPVDLATGGSPAFETRKVTLNHLANNILDETLTANRSLDIDGNMLKFDNGQVVIGTELGSLSKLEVVGSGATRAIVALSTGTIAVTGADSTGNGVHGYTVSGVGVFGNSAGSGIAVYGTSVSGLAGHLSGGLLVEPYGFGSSPVPSAVATFNASDKGVLLPRLTTAERDAIPTPALGLLIFNTTTGRFEYYNGTYWRGLTMGFLPIHFTSWSPTGAQTVAFGSHPFTPVQASISPAPFEIVMRGNGVIRGCDFNTHASGVAGTNEAWSLYVRRNGTDYLVQTLSLATAKRVFTNQSLNIPFVDGDIVRMILVNPTWTTNPTIVAATGSLNIQ